MTKHESVLNEGVMNALHENVSPRQFSDELIKLSVLWQRRYRILAAMLAGGTLAAVIVLQMTPIYKATGQLMVAGGESRVIDIANVSPDRTPNEPVVQSEVSVLTSRSLLASVATDLELAKYAEFNPSLRQSNLLSRAVARIRSSIESFFFTSSEENPRPENKIGTAVGELATKLSVRPLGVSYVIEITTSSENPELAAKITNSIIKHYLANQVESKNEASQRAISWLEGRVSALRNDLIAAEQSIEDFKAKAASEGYSAGAAIALRELQREAEASRAVYEQFLVRLKETRERSSFQEPDARIVSLAQAPSSPVSPQKSLLVLLGGIGGGSLGIVVTLIVDARRQTLNSEDDVRKHCELALIGNIPKVVKVSDPLEILNWLSDRPFSALAESIRWLSLKLSLDNEPGRATQVIVVTSALPSEGKSTLALLLAHNSMSNGSKTLVFDADLRRKSISNMLSATNTGQTYVEDRGFTVYRCDESIGGDHGIFRTSILREVLDAARQRYKTIIIDAPPVLSVSEIASLCRNADKTIMVCRWGVTPFGAVQQAVRQLRDLNVNVHGLVLTMVDLKRQAETAFSGGGYALKESMKYYTDEVGDNAKSLDSS